MDYSDASHAVAVVLAERKQTQAQLAEQLGIFPSVLNRMLKQNQLLSQRSNWPEVLDALGLEVVIRPKQGTGQ